MSDRARRIGCLVAAALLMGLAGTAEAAIPTLYVSYNSSNCTFTVTNDGGATLTTLAPGNYQVDISTSDPYALVGYGPPGSLQDCGGYVQFSMTGPGVDLMTNLGDGDDSSELDSVTLQAGGTYTMEDASNVAGSKTTLSVSTTGSAGPVSACCASSSSLSSTGSSSPSIIGSKSKSSKSKSSSSSSDALKFVGTLRASVDAAGKVSLTRNGNAVLWLERGKYTFSVRDKSSKAGFSIQASGRAAQALTSASFVGRHSVTVSLEQGQWSFFASRGAKTSFFVLK